MGEGKGALIRRLQRGGGGGGGGGARWVFGRGGGGGGGGGGRSFDILAMGVDGYQSVGAYSKKYGNGEVLNRYKCHF